MLYRIAIFLLLLFFLLLSIASIAIAAKYGTCPAEPRLAPFHKITGSFGIILSIVGILVVMLSYDDEKKKKSIFILTTVLSIFLLVTRIPGSIYTFGVIKIAQRMNLLVNTYCHPRLMSFSNLIIGGSYLLTLILTVISVVRCYKNKKSGAVRPWK